MSDAEGPSKRLPDFRKPTETGTPRKTFRSLLILGGLMVGVFMMIFGGMGWLAREDLSAAELYSRSLDGRRDAKRMAILEWARRLHLYESRDQVRQVQRLAPDLNQSRRLGEVLRQELGRRAGGGESAEAAYLGGLVTVLGFSRAPVPAVRDLEEALISIRPREWSEVQIPLVLALSRLGLPLTQAGEERLLLVLSENDPALRKSGVFAVGVLAQSPQSRQVFHARVLELRRDFVSDVRWNAGFTLGRWRDPAAEPVLAELVELAQNVRRDATIESEPGEVMSESLFLSLAQAFQVIAQLNLAELREKLAVISREHPHLKLRQAAISALKN
jgi:hypothetical protein